MVKPLSSSRRAVTSEDFHSRSDSSACFHTSSLKLVIAPWLASIQSSTVCFASVFPARPVGGLYEAGETPVFSSWPKVAASTGSAWSMAAVVAVALSPNILSRRRRPGCRSFTSVSFLA